MFTKIRIFALCAVLLLSGSGVSAVAAKSGHSIQLYGVEASYEAGATIKFRLSDYDDADTTYKITEADSGLTFAEGVIADGNRSSEQSVTAPNAAGTYILTVYNGLLRRPSRKFTVTGGTYSGVSAVPLIDRHNANQSYLVGLRLNWMYGGEHNEGNRNFDAFTVSRDSMKKDGTVDMTGKAFFDNADVSHDERRGHSLIDSSLKVNVRYRYTIKIGNDTLTIYATVGDGGGVAFSDKAKEVRIIEISVGAFGMNVYGSDTSNTMKYFETKANGSADQTVTMTKDEEGEFWIPLRGLVEATKIKSEADVTYEAIGNKITITYKFPDTENRYRKIAITVGKTEAIQYSSSEDEKGSEVMLFAAPQMISKASNVVILSTKDISNYLGIVIDKEESDKITLGYVTKAAKD